MQKQITITAVEQKDTKVGPKIILHTGKDKYEFFVSKKDGNKTKAFEQYKQFKIGLGDSQIVEAEEKPETFINGKGETVNFIRKTILYFVTDENKIPKGYVAQAHGEATLEDRITALENWKMTFSTPQF
jgi:hypothetical protein